MKLGDDQDVDPEDRHHEGRTHVAEGDPGDFPLAVPKQGRVRLVVRLAVQGNCRFRHIAPVRAVDRGGDGDHAVDRRLVRAGEFARDHFGGAPVVPEDREGCGFARYADDVAEFDDIASAR